MFFHMVRDRFRGELSSTVFAQFQPLTDAPRWVEFLASHSPESINFAEGRDVVMGSSFGTCLLARYKLPAQGRSVTVAVPQRSPTLP